MKREEREEGEEDVDEILECFVKECLVYAKFEY